MREDRSEWDRLEGLLDALLDLPEPDRPAFIADVERRDPADARVLRDWLRGIEQSAGYLSPRSSPRPGASAGELIGNWRLLRLLGRGGMGEVWLGERADGLFAKQVAVKVIRDERPQLARHIESERRLLAPLQHPGIVRLLDAGTTADGHPFLVTDYIDGVTLDLWRRQRRPSLERRLEVFGQVVRAVAHAHEHLVVHRDIKPGNVLVGRDGRAHLLDFGIASALGGEQMAGGLVALTPEFAAPESVTGRDVSVRTDVHALGGLLYFLICGEPPLALRGLPMADVEQALRERTPLPPSRRLSAGDRKAAPRRLLADLDAIALKALAKAPQERHGSAEALLADVEAARENRPVAARPADTWDRLGRLWTRNSTPITVAALLLVSLVVGLVGTLWQAYEARLQRDRAEAEAARATAQAATANAVRDFLIGVFESANPEATGGRAPTALDLVDDGVRQAETTLGQQPEMQARLFEALGRTYTGLGEYGKAAALLEKAHGIAARHFGEDSELAVALAIALASAIGHGDGPYDSAIGMLEGIAGDTRATIVPAQPSAVAAYQLATLQRRVGRLDEAEANFRRSIEDLRELGPAAEVELSEALHQYAGLAEARGRRGEAIERLREAIRIRERGTFGPAADLNFLREELANLLGGAGRNDEAVAILREVAASNRAIYGDAHPRTLLSSSWLARSLVRQSAYGEADALLERVLGTSREEYGDDAETTAGAEVALAASKFAQGDLDTAIAYGERVRRYAVAHGGEDSYRAIVTTQNIARFRLANGEYAAAEKIALDVLASLRRIGSQDTADALELVGNARQYRGDAAGARETHREALDVLRRNGDESSFDVQMLKTELAEDERDLGDLAAARGHAREALDGLLKLDQESNAKMIAFTRYLLAQFDVLEGRCDGVKDIETIVAQNRATAMTPLVEWRNAWAEFLLATCRLRQPGADLAAARAQRDAQARFLRESPVADPHVKRFVHEALRKR